MKSLLLALGLCLLFSLLLSLAVVDGDNLLTRFDHNAVNTLHEHTTTTGVDFFERVTWLGSPGTWFVSLGTLAVLTGCTRWVDFFTGAATIGGGKLLNVLLKELFGRPRPAWNGVFITESSLSFPSGHAMMSLLVYGFVALLLWHAFRVRWLRIAVVLGTMALVELIGFSRVYLGVHYPTDVLGGYAVGGAWLSLCLLGKIEGESLWRARLARFAPS